MKREDLIKLGVAEELIDKIMELHGKDIEGHKTKLAEAAGSTQTLNQQITDLQKQVTDANAQIEQFKGMNIDQIKAAAEDWKAKFEKAQADSAAQIQGLRFDHALEGALTAAKAKKAQAVRPFLKVDALKLKEDGTIEGLDEQLKAVKAENAFLFDDGVQDPKIVDKTTVTQKPANAFVASVFKGAGMEPPK